MATLETQVLDKVIVNSRRKMLALGGTALAGLFLAGTKKAEAATYTDADILNFALNLEYLEANYYYLAAFGGTIDAVNPTASAAGAAQLSLNGGVRAVGAGITPATGLAPTYKVPFGTTATEIAFASYCIETAIEEGKHVKFLQAALGTTAAVPQPLINLGTGTGEAWPTLATAATIPNGSSFSPYGSSTAFLYGAYVFEDVGVTAYHGAAPLITVAGNLAAAAGILGVEAYHAGLVRTSLTVQDQTNNNTNNAGVTQLISNLRLALAGQALLGKVNSALTLDPATDDFGTATFSLSLAGVTATGTRIVDADSTDSVNPIPLAIAFARTTSQVLNIVTGGGAVSNAGTSTAAAVSPAKGVFFPNGLNGLFK